VYRNHNEYGAPSSTSDCENKYYLSVGDTVEAYKLLNLWREVRLLQDAMEVELGMKDGSGVDGGVPPCVTNRIEPLFLYEENTEEKQRKEKDGLSNALRKILDEGISDNADASSDEMLLKKLFAVQGRARALVPLLTETLTRQDEDVDVDDDLWNIIMSVATCLQLIANTVEDDIALLIMPFVQQYITSENWRYR